MDLSSLMFIALVSQRILRALRTSVHGVTETVLDGIGSSDEDADLRWEGRGSECTRPVGSACGKAATSGEPRP